MATSAELTFMRAVVVAESVRQAARAAAFATWAYGTGSALTTYMAALTAADNAYITAVQAACNTAGAIGISVPNAGPSVQTPHVNLGNVGDCSSLPVGSHTYGSVA
jgi:hypothetical protein